MPPKPTAGSGFAAAKAATALKLSAKAATASKGKQPGRSLDDELAAAWKVAPTQGEETCSSSQPSLAAVSLSTELAAKLNEEPADMQQAARNLLELLMATSAGVHASVLRWESLNDETSGCRVCWLRMTALGEHPSLIRLGRVALVRAETARATRLAPSRHLPTAISPMLVHPPLAGQRCDLPLASWRSIEPSRCTEDSGLLQTWADWLAAYLKAPPSHAQHSEAALYSVLEELWDLDGPLARLAGTTAERTATSKSWLVARLGTLTHELSQQLLPALKDTRRSALTTALHAPLLSELSNCIALKELATVLPPGQQLAWGSQPDWFEQSELSQLACDERSEPVRS